MKYKHKMVIVMRTDLRMGRGKMASQAAHAASLRFCAASQSENVNETEDAKLVAWVEEGMAKIVVRAETVTDFYVVRDAATIAGLHVCPVTDATLKVPTCFAIGPDLNEEIDAVTGRMKLL